MDSNVFYVYIRLTDAARAELPSSLSRAISSDYGDNKILSLSVCKEREIDDCLSEKLRFWHESAVNLTAELVIHQICVSNGGLELSPAILRDIAESNLTLSITHTDITLM